MKNIILFGDSITAGYLEEAVSPILVNMVKQKLQQAAIEEVTIINGGMPGDTTVDGLARMAVDVLAETPDLVVIFFGANDASTARKVSLAAYQQNLITMIQTIGPEKVILVTAPYTDSARKPDRPQDRIRENVAVGLTLRETYHIPVINLFEEMVSAPDTDQLLQADGLHFTQAGYELLSTLIVQAIKGRLKAN
ncbi:GDSL-type esterase/lipase family protein [Enterococcus faecalis]